MVACLAGLGVASSPVGFDVSIKDSIYAGVPVSFQATAGPGKKLVIGGLVLTIQVLFLNYCVRVTTDGGGFPRFQRSFTGSHDVKTPSTKEDEEKAAMFDANNANSNEMHKV